MQNQHQNSLDLHQGGKFQTWWPSYLPRPTRQGNPISIVVPSISGCSLRSSFAGVLPSNVWVQRCANAEYCIKYTIDFIKILTPHNLSLNGKTMKIAPNNANPIFMNSWVNNSMYGPTSILIKKSAFDFTLVSSPFIGWLAISIENCFLFIFLKIAFVTALILSGHEWMA